MKYNLRSLRCALLFFVAFLTTAPLVAQQEQADHAKIHKFIDQWHFCAAQAERIGYFGAMSEDFVYIGTDASERWNKTEFIKFAKPYFDKKKAWDFKPYDRELHVSPDGQYVWFSELLTTWMGVCRGSGVISLSPKGWRFEQYHLSVTVPNDLIKDFISLVEKSTPHRKD